MNFANCRARQAAFTLMEMMIVVAIVGILAAIALPAYNDQVTRSRIIDGTTKLGDFRSQMEKYFLDWRTYRTVPAAGNSCGVPDPAVGGGDAFQITCVAPSATTYTVTATGIAARGMSGFVYDIDQTNLKRSFPSGPPAGWTTPAPVNDCWAIRKDGTCQ
jgi:type IV pilus assembly protein PilE